MNPHGTVNHLASLARKLPPATMVGEWTVVSGVRFQVAAGRDEHGQPALAWEVMNAPLYFQPVYVPTS